MAERVEPIFQDLKAGVENIGATEIESLCVNCFENVSCNKFPSRNVLLSSNFTCRAKRDSCSRRSPSTRK